MRVAVVCGIVIWLLCAVALAAEEPVFSGPQVGEALPEFAFHGVYGEEAGRPIDIVARAGEKPVALIFVHERTRPGIGLTRAVMTYAARKTSDDLHAAVVFLTDDPTATEQWMRIPSVRDNALPQQVALGIFKDGGEGPGAYGLNRNVELTMLIAKEGKVTANFALVQPSVQADGPKILQAIADATGGEVPSLESLGVREMRAPPKNRPAGDAAVEAKLRELVRPLLRAATAEDANKAAQRIDAYAAEHPEFARELRVRAKRIAASPKFAEYGQVEAARTHIRRWADQQDPEPKP
ncbi:MAG: hypothetical protein KY475_10630 [Planctomycetes bacterium]|nr:hypothetical protein [Planctomycetota bacterium]